jgi:serine protease Do
LFAVVFFVSVAHPASTESVRIAAEDAALRSDHEPPAATSGAERLYAALVRVQAVATPNARSNSELGREREGTGTVIGSDGLILTIGYLVLEAEEVKVTDWRGRTYPTRVLAHDHATGLSLLKTTVPLNIVPVPFGDSSKLADREPVLIAGWGGVPDTARAYIVSRRPFTANWEYMLDEAIFTSPPTTGWSGAALVDRGGTIVGVGSLLVPQATTDTPRLPGNMFVPINALKPILDDLVKSGRRHSAPRPWLGVVVDEVSGRLVVSGLSPEGPAQSAGVKKGDIILGVGADAVRSYDDFYRKLWRRSSAGDVITLRVLQGVEIHEIDVKSIGRDEYFRSGSSSRRPDTARLHAPSVTDAARAVRMSAPD